MSDACPICAASTRPTHTAEVLRSHEARYRICPACDYWFVVDPTWLDEAYSSAIAATDTGLVARNLIMRDLITPVLMSCFDPRGVFVDYAGGYGLLVRLMRDRGFDFRWQDAYAENLFAAGFEWPETVDDADGAAPQRAEAVTAIEVFEHTSDPVGFVEEVVAATGTDSIVFSQELHHGVDPSWWYLATETGQHVSFYTARTLGALGERVGMTYAGSGSLHLLTSRSMRDGLFVAKARQPSRLARLRGAGHLPSRGADDHRRAVERASAPR